MRTPSFLILTGDGINCERESARAIEVNGGNAVIVHVNDLITTPSSLLKYQGLVLPGGFSFGDELGSGLILATKIKHQLSDTFREFVARKGAILGICNGFQVLTKLGLLPFPFETRGAALARNTSGHFMNKWAQLHVSAHNPCHWLRELEGQTFELPVRHGEGRLLFRDEATHARIKELGLGVITYNEDINGSTDQIAGLTDPSGMILGMMPHPEAYVFEATAKNPTSQFQALAPGARIFSSMIKYLQEA